MTIEEALHELKIQSQVLESMILYNKDFEPRNDNTSLENKNNAIDMAIAALEKQIPKKPLQYEHDYICLCCGYVLAESVDDNCDLEEEMAGWCPYCGAVQEERNER